MIRKCLSSSSLCIEGYNKEAPQFKKKRTETIGGKCSCGAVQISVISKKPLSSYYCHCKRCRKATGCCVNLIATIHTHDLTIIGEENLKMYHSAKTKFYSCENCTSWIYLESNNSSENFFFFTFSVKHISLSIIDWEENKILESWKPTCHEWYSERLIDFPDCLPKYSENSEILSGIYIHHDENSLRPSLFLELNDTSFYIRVKWAVPNEFTFRQVEYCGTVKKIDSFDNRNYLLECKKSQLQCGKKEDCTKTFTMVLDQQEKKVILVSKGILGKLCTVAKNEYILFHKENH